MKKEKLRNIRHGLPGYRSVKSFRLWWRGLRKGKQLQKEEIINLSKERDAALQELGYLRGNILELEKRAFSVGLIKLSEARYIFPEKEKWLSDTESMSSNQLVVTKQARGRIIWNGLSDRQAFYLEAESLRRLNCSELSLAERRHFPRLFSLDSGALTVTMSHNGITLDKLKRKVSAPNVESQILTIARTFEKSSVVHLDISRGKNITVDDKGTLCLIDFDIACLDDLPLSGKIQERYDAFLAKGGYAGFIDEMREVTLENPMIEPA